MATSASMAPAAKAKETGSRPWIVSTIRNAASAPTGCSALVSTAAQNCCRRLEPRLRHRDRDACALGNVLQSDREDDEQAQAGDIGRVRRPDRESLGEAVNEEDREHQNRGPDAGAPQMSDVDVGSA